MGNKTYYIQIEGQGGYNSVIKVENASDEKDAILKALSVNVDTYVLTRDEAIQLCINENIIPFDQDGEECEL